MSQIAETQTASLRPLPQLIFGSRWLQLPLYLGLIAAQGVHVVLFLKELWHPLTHATSFTEQQMLLVVLGLIDVVLWQTLIHLTFIVSAIGIAAVDRMGQFTLAKPHNVA